MQNNNDNDQGFLHRAGNVFVAMPDRAKVVMAVALSLLAIGTTWLVYATGGIRYSYSHLMYVSIALSALTFGMPGGLVAGVVCGLLLGPMMPINTTTGEMQDTLNWTYRVIFFCAIGALVGASAQLLRKHLRELEWLHEHHPESGLLNLPGLLKRLDELIRGAPKGRTITVSVTQFDNLLEIQNTFGVEFGARLLTLVLKRAKELVAPSALLAVIQPDRLATVIEGEEHAREARGRLEAAMQESFVLEGVPIHVVASIGVASFPVHGRKADELLQKAGIAMHWAGISKSYVADYDGARDRTSRDNLILLGGLLGAIADNELRVWHQAQIDLRTGEVVGTEALLRWQHRERGLVPPGDFIPQLEDTSLVNPVTQWVINAACADAGSWRATGFRPRISINLSVRNLHDRMLLEVLDASARRHGLGPGQIDLELTESAIMSDVDNCVRLISLLRARGYGVSLDDFGVGQSSFGYLQKLRVSAIKIDQTFVKTLATDANNQKIVRALLQLARSMGLETVAEGVEDEAALALLRDWGCDRAQGYAIHRPAPAAELPGFIASRQAGAATARA